MDALPERSRDHVDAIEALRDLVGQSPRTFSLNLAVCDDTGLRDELVDRMRAAHSAIDIVSLWPYEADVFEHVHEHTADTPKDAVFVAGLDDALAADIDRAGLLTRLNGSPPRWKAWFACPIVFWLDRHTADILREQARDFWEWQDEIFRLDV